MVMLVPLGVLALGAVLAGMVWYNSFFGNHEAVNRFFGVPAHHAEASEAQGSEAATEADAPAVADAVAPQGAIFMHPDNHVMDEAHHAPAWVKVSPFIAMLIGFLTAVWFYVWDPSMPRKVAETQRPLYLFLLNKWYFDEIYGFLFVRPAKALGHLLWRRGDGDVIDGSINGVAMGLIPWVTRLAGRAQSGYIFTYAFAMVIGIAVLVTWMTIFGGGN